MGRPCRAASDASWSLASVFGALRDAVLPKGASPLHPRFIVPSRDF